jgi:hypothetical protein
MRVKPAPGVKVRHPISRQHIPDSGIDVSDADSFWIRRLIDGDVVLVVEPVSPNVKSKQIKE